VIVAGVIMALAFVFPLVFPTVFGMLAFVFGGYVALFPIAIVVALVGSFAVLPIKSGR
jgi:hypothetical protein